MNERPVLLNTLRSLLLTTLFIALLVSTTSCAEPSAANGDTVTVDYIGLLDDGTVFDTSIAQLALDAGTYDASRNYAPLRVTLGSGNVILGFNDALVGMRAGENKTVAIPPEFAYGKWSQGKLLSTRTVRSAPRLVVVEKKGMPALEEGQRVRIQDTLWSSTVVAVGEETYTLRQDPEEGSVVQSPFGPTLVTIDGDNVTTRLLLEPGAVIQNEMGAGRVVSVNETTAVIDYNHPLAGKTLIFQLYLRSIEKAEQ